MRVNLDNLIALGKALHTRPTIQIGIFSGKGNRNDSGKARKTGGHRKVKGTTSDQTNADIGAAHELGVRSHNLPSRSWLRMPLSTKTKEIMAEGKIGAEALILQGKMMMVWKRIGIAAEKMVQAAFDSNGFGTWQALKASTVAAKHSATILIDTAQMRRAVSSRVRMGI